jgi:intraflagellar transport protein 140
VHYADDLGHISDIQVLNHAIESMMFYEEQSRLLVITRAVQLIVYQVGATDGTVKPITKVKLSLAGEGSMLETKWAGPGLLAISSGEPLVRFWNIRTEENSVLSLPKSSGLNYNVNNLTFSPRRRVLVAGTAQGAVFIWRATSYIDTTQGNTDPCVVSYRWDLLFTAEVGRAVTRIGWSNAHPALYANTVDGVVILHEGNMQRALCGDTAVIQVRPKTLSIEKFQDGAQSGVTITQSTLEASLRIKGVSHDGSTLVVWNGSKAEVYEMKDGDAKAVNQFKCFSSSMVLRDESIYRANGNHVEVCNLAGVVKKTISFTEAEGRPGMLSLQSKFLAVGTDRGLLRVFDVSRRDPKALGSMGNLPEAFGEETKSAVMRSICVNSDGTRICILADRVEGALRVREPLSKLFLFQTDLNIYQQFDFGAARYPISVFFDPQEPRLLVCETVKTGNEDISTTAGSGGAGRRDLSVDDAGGARGSQVSDKEVTIIFASNEHGLLMQDSFDLDLKYSALLGIQVPRVYFVAKVDTGSSDDSTTVVHVGRTKNNPVAKSPMVYDTVSYLRTQIMRDFTGLDKVNNEAKQALIDFCYFMTVGNMDEAYRSVKLIENPSVWENMARMCVKTKRLDVAEVCLGNMGHARGAVAVQEAKMEPELEVAIAMVAIQLGLRDDAARLYRECGRYDLLNKLYQASGYWKKAVDVASKRDRIHLKTTYHALARHYEEMGDIKEAMEAYEDAGTHHKDIPRMLFKLGKVDLLQKYVATSSNRDLLVWWAQFQESQGQFDAAVESYQRANDYLSIVRVLCFKKDFQGAAKVAQTSGDRAAAYHLARQFEAHNEISNAIHFFASGGCYNHAIRLAKEHRMDADLMGFALMSKPGDMLDCAAYFEEQREMEKAVQLYHKGGNVAKALDLCFQAQLFEELHHLTDELSGSGNTSPAILKKCADFFIANGQYAKAVHLCLIGSRVAEALDVCMQHGVKVSEEMAEKMTPPKGDDTASPADKKRRTDLLLKLAKCCKQQGSYHLATKKYTQAGNKLKAMKCLLKSGDTEKVVFFANVSRNAQIFVLAANYLQNLDWRKDPEIMKNIVGFYTKARAFEQLAAFYAGCAQVEIEEYRDYEKAVSALQEAVQVVSKSRADGKDALLQRYEKRILLIEQFIVARQQAKHNPKKMMDIVTKLLEEPGIEEAIRVGDGYAMLTEAYYEEGELTKSFEAMEEMTRKGLTVKTYVDPRVVEAVQAKLGVSLGDDRRRRPSPSDYKQTASSSSSRPNSREAKSSRPSSREAQPSREAHSSRPGSREAAMSRPNSREDKMGRPGDDEEVEDEMEEDIAEDE